MEFCKRYSLQKAPAYYAIKYLEREGHWTLSEDIEIQTRIRIKTDRTELYSTDLPDARMPQVLETLMRMYTGIFSSAIPVDEEEVAARCGVNVATLRQLFYGLSVNHVVNYIPADRATVIFIGHDRLRPGNVKLSPERYRLLRSTCHERIETMTDYVQTRECRSRFLLRYFGQDGSEPCGNCDVCRASASGTEDISTALCQWIKLRGGNYTLARLKAAFGPADDSYLEVLRELIDNGTVPVWQD